MFTLRAFLARTDGAVSVEWVAATAALLVVSAWFAYGMFFGVNAVQYKNSKDFNRVETGVTAPGGDGSDL